MTERLTAFVNNVELENKEPEWAAHLVACLFELNEIKVKQLPRILPLVRESVMSQSVEMLANTQFDELQWRDMTPGKRSFARVSQSS